MQDLKDQDYLFRKTENYIEHCRDRAEVDIEDDNN